MVRDGTYLVGTCAIISANDTKIVYQSHIYKIRSNDFEKLNPNLLLAVSNSPIVKEEIYSKRFTQDIIDTLGGRIQELILPIPKNKKLRDDIIAKVEQIMYLKKSAGELTRKAVLGVAPYEEFDDDFEFLTLQY